MPGKRLRNRPVRRSLFRLAARVYGNTLWQDLAAYCVFVGYTRSGHSAVGSAIDAHPHAVVSQRLGAVPRYFRGTTRPDLLFDIFWRAREQAILGRLSPKAGGGSYRHVIEGQFKRTPRGVRVIGDKNGAGTVQSLAVHGIDRLADFGRFIGLPIKILHVMRNPFDMVAAGLMNQEGDTPHHFLRLAPIVAELRSRYGGADWLDVYHEDVCADPRNEMGRIVSFLGLPVFESHLDHCAEYFYDEPHKRRFAAPWTVDLKMRVQAMIARHDHFSRYDWQS